MRQLFRNNGLSIVVSAMFLTFLIAQSVVGHKHYNREQEDHRQATLTYPEYLRSSHFLEATMENWESEFLQMYFFIILTAFLYQRGSAESEDPDKEKETDKELPKSNRKDAPWPVRKGGWALKLYEHSLSLAFLSLFLMSFFLHAVGGAREYNEEQRTHGRGEQITTIEYMVTSRFWFESFQNWQSEFLAVGSMVVLTIFLREKGSKESKRVASPHSETGK
jgi:Domain of unknown function (DUF6766)